MEKNKLKLSVQEAGLTAGLTSDSAVGPTANIAVGAVSGSVGPGDSSAAGSGDNSIAGTVGQGDGFAAGTADPTDGTVAGAAGSADGPAAGAACNTSTAIDGVISRAAASSQPSGLYIKQNGQWSRAEGVAVKTSDPHISIAFYDWDDTLLGTRAVRIGGSLTDPNTAENRPNYINDDGTPKYTDDELAAMGVAPLAPEGELLGTTPGNKREAVSIYNKAGYSYAGWVDFSGTSTPNVPITTQPQQTIEGSGQTLIPLTNLRKNLRLRAAYDEKDIGAGGNSNRRYMIDYTPFAYNASGAYLSTKICIYRTGKGRRENGTKWLTVDMRFKAYGDYPFKFLIGQSDFETYELEMMVNAGSALSDNALSFSADNDAGQLIANGANADAAEIVAPAT